MKDRTKKRTQKPAPAAKPKAKRHLTAEELAAIGKPHFERLGADMDAAMERLNSPVSAAPAEAKPEPPAVTQGELQACIKVLNALEEIGAGFARRLLAGAKVEPGPATIEWDGEPRARADNVVNSTIAGLILHFDSEPEAGDEPAAAPTAAETTTDHIEPIKGEPTLADVIRALREISVYYYQIAVDFLQVLKVASETPGQTPVEDLLINLVVEHRRHALTPEAVEKLTAGFRADFEAVENAATYYASRYGTHAA